MITLNAKQAIGQLVVSGTPMNDKNGLPYFRVRYAGKGFIIREDVYNDWKAGKIFEITLNPTTRTVTDDEGNESEVAGYEYAGHITVGQMVGVTKGEVELKKLEKELLADTVIENAAAALALDTE